MSKLNEGAVAVAAWRKEQGITPSRARLLLGLNYLEIWETGDGLPGLRSAALLEDKLKIPMRAWLTPAKRSSKAA